MNASTGTFTPRPGAAPLVRQVVAQTTMETRLLLRHGEQLLLALAIPVVVLVGGVLAAEQLGLVFARGAVDTLTPGVLALAVMSTSFTSLAIATGFERRYGVLKFQGSSPMPRGGLLAGKVAALLVVQAMQLVVVSAVALTLGWSPEVTVTSIAAVVVFLLLGTAAFAALGLLLAGTLRAEATLAVANLVYLLLLAGGAVVFPASSYGFAGPVLALLPSGALGTGMRAALLDGSLALGPVVTLVVWAVAGGVLTARTFRWE